MGLTKASDIFAAPYREGWSRRDYVEGEVLDEPVLKRIDIPLLVQCACGPHTRHIQPNTDS